MAIVRLFASAREAAGRGRDEIDGADVAEILDRAAERYGDGFARVLPTCRVWLNGDAVPDDARRATPVGSDDEVAVLPPVSGGAPADAPADADPGAAPGAPTRTTPGATPGMKERPRG